MFSFDNVFSDKASTTELFEKAVKENVKTAIEGFNVTVFAYGQTSSGKTFTMRGNEDNMGLIPLSVQQIFQDVAQDSERDYKITVSYLEVSLSPLTFLRFTMKVSTT